MLQYFRPITAKGSPYTISIDKVVIDYKISSPQEQEGLIKFLENVTFRYGCELSHFESLKMGRFHLNFTITFRDGTSFWLGMGLNQTKTIWQRTRLEFNPNKVANHQVFREILRRLNCGGHRAFTEIKRFDLALDMPTERENVFLVKDGRAYSEIRHSAANLTQYLGSKSSTVGRCKLYNKTIESKLNYPLTRLEITLGNPLETTYRDIPWPTVYCICNRQMSIDEQLRFTDTERFILNSLLQGCGTLPQLGRRTRTKMETLLKNYVDAVTIPAKVFDLVRSQLTDFTHYPTRPLEDGEIDCDSPLLQSTKQQAPDYAAAISNSDFVEIDIPDEGLPF